jgi:CxxC motif-containing protein (DUF1111 family)
MKKLATLSHLRLYRLHFLLIVHAAFFSSITLASDADIVKPTHDFSKAEKYELLPAGALTHKKTLNHNAFSHPSANMNFERRSDFNVGNALFKRIWVSSPSSTQASDGLGPLFNARACQRCHIKDGRGHPPANADDNAVSMLMRLSVPPENDEQQALLDSRKINSIPHKIYGGQLQDRSVPGLYSEGKFTITYTEIPVTLADGETASLRKPQYHFSQLHYGKLPTSIRYSPRIAQQMIGLGLLEAIDEKDIIQQADPHDKNNDGISGKAQQVWSHEYQKVMLGRFGHKAGMPTLNQQNQAAFGGDIGLGTPLFPNAYGDCTKNQTACLNMPTGNSSQYDHLEVDQTMAELVLHYTRNLSVPARRNVSSPEVLAGKKLFYTQGCIDCHTPKYITPRHTAESEQARQLIWPYTDMLLHDMGEGLADGFIEASANGQEWRTPPLWGIGLTPTVNGHSLYLHDGRARNILEAILWHGGEAATAKNNVVSMTKKQRQQLIQFVESL